MKKFFSGLIVLLASGLVVAAEKPADERTKLAVQLLQVMDFDSMMRGMSAQFTDMFDKQIRPLATCQDAQTMVADYSKELSGTIVHWLNSDAFKTDVAAIYAEVLDEEELRQSIAFYSSPVGKKLLVKMPELMRRSVEMSQARIKDATPDIMEISGRYTKKMADACKSANASSH